ncbi:MAG: topoisomerase DNA-binding C4 zinc finger domain-containing protein, partial [Hyphomicrobiales bacterium]|nr:topoisomerase DNA-binding C4 zinc finger domain-containing protein [Hyphomicrobiales bacterium]
ITYMRTDGVDMAPEAVAATRATIAREFGDRYVPKVPRAYSTKAKNAQEAHEAIRPTDPKRRPKDVARFLEPEQLKLYELVWKRTIASQMESAEFERTSVDILGAAPGSPRKALDLRATGQVVRFDGFLAAWQDAPEDDEEEGGRLPAMAKDETPARERIETTQHFTEPPPRFTEDALIKRMEELGIGRPSTYASTLAVLRDRGYVRVESRRMVPEDKGRLLTAFLESSFARYVDYDFTADLEQKLDLVSDGELDWKALMREFWTQFSAALDGAKELRTSEILENLNELLGSHIFPAKADGSDARACPSCGAGRLSLKVGKFGAFIGCSNYPECKFTRTMSPSAAGEGDGQPGNRSLGVDPDTGEEITLRDGRFGPYVQQGDGEKPKRSSLPRGLAPADVTLEKALGLLALPREVARHPTTGEPILAGLGRFGPYVKHGKTYASLGRDDDVLEVGANRAIDLVVTKESGGGGSRFGRAEPGRSLGDHPGAGGAVTVRKGRYGAYVNHGKVNATLPKDVDPEALTIERAVELLAAKAKGVPTDGRVIGDHPEGGAIVLREGRYGPYVSHGKVNANVPKETDPGDLSLSHAIELIDGRGGPDPKLTGKSRGAAKKSATKKTAAVKTPAKKLATKKSATVTKTTKASAKPKAGTKSKAGIKARASAD